MICNLSPVVAMGLLILLQQKGSRNLPGEFRRNVQKETTNFIKFQS